MERRAPSAAHLSLIAWASVSVASFAVSFGAWPVLALLAPMMFSAVRRADRVAEPVQRWLQRIGWLVAAAVALLPLVVTFQTMNPALASKIAMPTGGALCVLATIFLYSASSWTPATTVIPVSLALLAAAGLRRDSAALVVLFAVAGVCALIYLAVGRPQRAVPLVLFVVGASMIAVGVTVALPWAQPWVETKAGDLFAPGRTARAGLSLTSRLGEIEQLGLSPDVALRVWTDRPQYLRARTHASFNGYAWSSPSATPKDFLLPAPPLAPELARWIEEVPGQTLTVPGGSLAPLQIRTRILSERPLNGVLPAPAQVSIARLDGNPTWLDSAGVLIPSRAGPDYYALVNRYDRDIAQPNSAPDDEALKTPATADPRLRELADRLRSGADPAERVRRTLAYLEANCTYSLNVGAFRTRDPVGEFVFDKRRGYCEYFATAAAVLLRMEGVPARYVVGYSVRPSNLEGGHYVVREADAHAWVEVWLTGLGWVEVDPTPAAQFESLREPIRAGTISGVWQRMRGWIAEAAAMWRGESVLAALRRRALPILGGIAVLAVAVAFFRKGRARIAAWFGRRRTPTPATVESAGVPAELTDLLRSLDRVWKRSGHPRPASRAPLEHLRGLPSAAKVGEDLVQVFYRCRYGGAAPSADEIAALRRALPRI